MYYIYSGLSLFLGVFFVQAEDGIRDLVRSRGLGDVYKRQEQTTPRDRNLCIAQMFLFLWTKMGMNQHGAANGYAVRFARRIRPPMAKHLAWGSILALAVIYSFAKIGSKLSSTKPARPPTGT